MTVGIPSSSSSGLVIGDGDIDHSHSLGFGSSSSSSLDSPPSATSYITAQLINFLNDPDTNTDTDFNYPDLPTYITTILQPTSIHNLPQILTKILVSTTSLTRKSFHLILILLSKIKQDQDLDPWSPCLVWLSKIITTTDPGNEFIHGFIRVFIDLFTGDCADLFSFIEVVYYGTYCNGSELNNGKEMNAVIAVTNALLTKFPSKPFTLKIILPKLFTKVLQQKQRINTSRTTELEFSIYDELLVHVFKIVYNYNVHPVSITLCPITLAQYRSFWSTQDFCISEQAGMTIHAVLFDNPNGGHILWDMLKLSLSMVQLRLLFDVEESIVNLFQPVSELIDHTLSRRAIQEFDGFVDAAKCEFAQVCWTAMGVYMELERSRSLNDNNNDEMMFRPHTYSSIMNMITTMAGYVPFSEHDLVLEWGMVQWVLHQLESRQNSYLDWNGCWDILIVRFVVLISAIDDGIQRLGEWVMKLSDAVMKRFWNELVRLLVKSNPVAPRWQTGSTTTDTAYITSLPQPTRYKLFTTITKTMIYLFETYPTEKPKEYFNNSEQLWQYYSHDLVMGLCRLRGNSSTTSMTDEMWGFVNTFCSLRIMDVDASNPRFNTLCLSGLRFSTTSQRHIIATSVLEQVMTNGLYLLQQSRYDTLVSVVKYLLLVSCADVCDGSNRVMGFREWVLNQNSSGSGSGSVGVFVMHCFGKLDELISTIAPGDGNDDDDTISLLLSFFAKFINPVTSSVPSQQQQQQHQRIPTISLPNYLSKLCQYVFPHSTSDNKRMNTQLLITTLDYLLSHNLFQFTDPTISNPLRNDTMTCLNKLWNLFRECMFMELNGWLLNIGKKVNDSQHTLFPRLLQSFWRVFDQISPFVDGKPASLKEFNQFSGERNAFVFDSWVEVGLQVLLSELVRRGGGLKRRVEVGGEGMLEFRVTVWSVLGMFLNRQLQEYQYLSAQLIATGATGATAMTDPTTTTPPPPPPSKLPPKPYWRDMTVLPIGIIPKYWGLDIIVSLLCPEDGRLGSGNVMDEILGYSLLDRNTYPTGSNSNMAYEKERMVLLSMCSTLAEGGSGQ